MNTRERVQSLLDFLLLFESEAAGGRARSVEEYQRLFPDIADAVAKEHARLHGIGSHTAIIEPDKPKPRIAHYVLERELGSGGQGRVFLATDGRMRRSVALKVLNRANLTPDKLQRFRREVEVIAKLDHAGLCTVYEADLDAARPYLAMRFVDGEDLSRKLAAVRASGGESDLVRPGDYPTLARLLHVFERTARALHAAHEAGVVHRDIKPANILVGGDGEPVIVDFGLARGDDTEFASLTRTDDVLGTPAYMAPELLESGHSSADRRVDVYALGVAMYECLTLERPFRAEHREALFQSILHGEYRNPRELNPLVNEDLRVVLATAMEHQATRRYATALEFAEDLRRVREHEPILARRASWMVRARRWSQRHPRIATAAALLLLTLGAWIGTLSYTLDQVDAQSRRAQLANARLLGVECRERSAAQLTTDSALALVLALEADRRDPGFESNMAMLQALLRLNEQRTFWLEDSFMNGELDVSRNGRNVLLASSNSQGFVYDIAANRAQVKTERIAKVRANSPGLAAFAPDGASFLVSDESPGLRLYDTRTGACLRSFAGHSKVVTSCRFSPDGRRILTSSFDGGVRIFDVDTGALQLTLGSPECQSTLAQFDAAGALVLTSRNSRADAPDGGTDNDPRVWDARTGELLATLHGHASPVRDARFTPDGTAVVTAEFDGILHVWDWRAATIRWTARLPGQAWCLSTSPDGARVAVGFESGVRVFDLASGSVAFDLSGISERSVIALDFSPDGRWIAAADYGGNVGAWSSRDGAQRFRTTTMGNLLRLAWLPDSRRFVAGGRGLHARLWTIDPLPGLVAWRGHAGAVRSAVFDSTSQAVLSAGIDGQARISSALDGSLSRTVEVGMGALVRAWFAVEEGSIVCLSQSGGVARIDLTSDQRRTLREPDGGAVTASTLTPSGEGLCFGLDDGRVVWMETRSGRIQGSVAGRGAAIRSVAISPGGERAAWGSVEGWAGLFEPDGGTELAFEESRNAVHRPQVFLVAFTSNGRRLVTCGDHGGVHEWDALTGEFTQQSLSRPFGNLAVLNGGTDFIATAHAAPQLFRQDAGMSAVRWSHPQPSPDNRITSLRISADDRFVLTASRGGVAQLTNALDGSPVLRFEHGESALTCAEFSPDGRLVVTASEDGSVRVWPIDVAALARAHVPSTPDMWPTFIPKGVEEQ